MRRLRAFLALSYVSCVAGSIFLGGCPAPHPEAATDGGRADDAGTSDAGTSDAGTSDAGTSDAGTITQVAFNDIWISSTTGTYVRSATTTVAFEGGPFSSVSLNIQLTSPCFPWSNWTTDLPPSGQDWPANCDAFDRNFDFTFDPAQASSDPPGFNVVHAITPFGGPETLNEDITDLANALPGMHTLQVVIPTYSDGAGMSTGSAGGWYVTATIVATPGTPPRKVLAALPLALTTSSPITQAPIPFTVPAGTTSARLEMRTSGHGGVSTSDSNCIGPAEEFCHRQLTVDVDGTALSAIDPWRTDCANYCTIATGGPLGDSIQYCQQNPCGSIQSVEAPRANWCPGSETAPFVWDATALDTPGQHQLTWTFSTIVSGGNWDVSAIYYAYGD
jgi:hypothetical protein